MRFSALTLSLIVVALSGCGTTRWTDTGRSATEQLLISDAMDRAVSRLDFRALAGRTVFLDTTHIKGATDSDYLISSLRQHMLATGCILRDGKDKADYIAEVRVGAVGTDRNEMMFGVPSVSLPVPVAVTGVPASIPEMQFAKKTKQRAVVKLAVFAYNAETGRPVWQSGIFPVESTAKDVWIGGAGPFQTGTIYDKTAFAGDEIDIPLIDFQKREGRPILAVADEAFFVDELPQEEKPAEEAVAEAPKTAPRAETPAAQSSDPPPPSQTAQTQPKSPPTAPGKPANTTVDPNVVPASNEASPEGGAQPRPPTPEKKSTEMDPMRRSEETPGEGKPVEAASVIALRIPEGERPRAMTGTHAPPAPLPAEPGDSGPSPPRLLNLEGVEPIPLRLPEMSPGRAGHILGLPPLPSNRSDSRDRTPASLTATSASP